MVRIEIPSERFKSVGYDLEHRVLEIEFHTEGIVQYYQVPEKAYAGLLNAKSNEDFFVNKIKYVYPYKRIDLTVS